MHILKDKTFLKIVGIVILLILIYTIFLSGLNFFRISRMKMSDALLKISLKIKPPSDYQNKIVIIAIDDPSLTKSIHRWPWPRSEISKLIQKLVGYQPKVVGFDLAFLGKSIDSDDDILLASRLRQLENCVVSAYFSPEGEYILPLKLIRDATEFGFVNKLRDKDNIIRSARVAVLSTKGDILDYSFETKVASQFLGLDSIEYDAKKITLKNLNRNFDIPLSRIGSIFINYRSRTPDYKTISFWKVLEENLPLDTFKDKIVLVGATSEIIHDIYPSPLGVLPGVYITANTIQTILDENFIKAPPLWLHRLVLLLLGIIVAFITYRCSLAKAFFCNTFLLIFLFIGCVFLFLNNYLIDFNSMLLVGVSTFLGISGVSYLRLAIETNILKSEASMDALTGIYGFRYFDRKLKNEVAQAKRYNRQLCMLILDIDFFKKINDTYGHDNGNIILKKIASILKDSSRHADVVARFGGEEFCIISPHITQENAIIFAERIRARIEKTPFVIKNEKSINLTVSIGLACLQKNNYHADSFLKSADNALYKAKDSGRNKVCVFGKD